MSRGFWDFVPQVKSGEMEIIYEVFSDSSGSGADCQFLRFLQICVVHIDRIRSRRCTDRGRPSGAFLGESYCGDCFAVRAVHRVRLPAFRISCIPRSQNRAAKTGIWVSAAILYVLETSPVLFRLSGNKGTDAFCIAGFVLSVIGLLLESTADLQKNRAKKKNPGRFVDTGLFRLVRCPNYFGEMVFWTGVFISGLNVYHTAGMISGLNVYHTAGMWICAVLGYAGIIYVMFGGARRLEIRQDKNYGSDPEYQKYKKTTPIMIPFVPIYSVKEHKWLVA